MIGKHTAKRYLKASKTLDIMKSAVADKLRANQSNMTPEDRQDHLAVVNDLTHAYHDALEDEKDEKDEKEGIGTGGTGGTGAVVLHPTLDEAEDDPDPDAPPPQGPGGNPTGPGNGNS